jgi:hypothetical protein
MFSIGLKLLPNRKNRRQLGMRRWRKISGAPKISGRYFSLWSSYSPPKKTGVT